ANILTDRQAHLVLFGSSPTSGYVFGGLRMLWSWGLDDWATLHGFGRASVSRVNSTLQVLTKNMLLAADNNTFGTDCVSPVRLTYYFAHTGPRQYDISLILKERDRPGRFSIVPVANEALGATLADNPFATAQLSGWASASDAYDVFVADVNGDRYADLIA